MKLYTKALLLGTILSLAFTPYALADKVNMNAIHTMEIKLANLEVDISKKTPILTINAISEKVE